MIFYRALVQGAGLNPINRMVKALLQAGLNPLPIFVASLKDPISVATLDQLFQAAPPEVILNCTSFAVGNPHGDSSPNNPLTAASARQAPVLQGVLAARTTGSTGAWRGEAEVSGLLGLLSPCGCATANGGQLKSTSGGAAWQG